MRRWGSFTLKWQVIRMNNSPLTPDGEEQKMQGQADDQLAWANAFEIVDDADYAVGDRKSVQCKALMKVIDAHYKESISLAHKAHKAICSARKSMFDPPDQASKIIGKKMANFQRQIQIETAEKQRILDEKAKADHEAECERNAKEMADKGELEAAKAIREMKADPVASEQVAEPVLMTKTKFRKDWEIVSLKIEDIPLEYLMIDKALIMKIIRAKKGQLQISGVEFKEISVAVRRGE